MICYSYAEQRFVTFGLLQGRAVAVVHTDRDDLTRIISARKATKYEQRIYFEQFSRLIWQRLDAMSDEDIDLSDCPEVTPELFAKATVKW